MLQGGAANTPDTFRGYLNEGGLYAERIGAHLPGFPDTNWASGTPLTGGGVHGAGVNFFRTTFDLVSPHQCLVQDVHLSRATEYPQWRRHASPTVHHTQCYNFQLPGSNLSKRVAGWEVHQQHRVRDNKIQVFQLLIIFTKTGRRRCSSYPPGKSLNSFARTDR